MSKSTTKKIPCCSYCEKPGHRINKCTDPAIQELLQEAEEASIINYVFYNEWNPKKNLDTREFIRAWLEELNSSELKVLAYRFNVPQDKKTCLDFLPRELYKKWIVPYDEATICGKMTLFSDERLEKWTTLLCEKFSLAPYRIRNEIQGLCYPYRRFFIDMKHCEPFAPTDADCPICFGNLTPENTVKTGCSHELCKQCVTQYMRSESKKKNSLSCPLCRTEIKKMSTSEKEAYNILRARFCKPPLPLSPLPLSPLPLSPLPPPAAAEEMPRSTPILVSQLVQQERATQERTKFYKKAAEALFWVFASAAVSSFITQVMTQVMKPQTIV